MWRIEICATRIPSDSAFKASSMGWCFIQPLHSSMAMQVTAVLRQPCARSASCSIVVGSTLSTPVDIRTDVRMRGVATVAGSAANADGGMCVEARSISLSGAVHSCARYLWHRSAVVCRLPASAGYDSSNAKHIRASVMCFLKKESVLENTHCICKHLHETRTVAVRQ